MIPPCVIAAGAGALVLFIGFFSPIWAEKIRNRLKARRRRKSA